MYDGLVTDSILQLVTGFVGDLVTDFFVEIVTDPTSNQSLTGPAK